MKYLVPHRRGLVLLMALFATLPLGAQKTDPSILQGEWAATTRDSVFKSAAVLELQVADDGTVQGTYHGDRGGIGTISGKLRGHTFEFVFTQTIEDCPGVFWGTASIDGPTGDGTYAGSDCLGQHLNGTLSIWRPSSSSSPSSTRWEQLNIQVEGLRRQGRYADALPVAEEALRAAESTFGKDDRHVATSLDDLAVLYKEQGKYGTAELLLDRALVIWEKALGPDHTVVVTAQGDLAELYRMDGRYAQAEPLYLRSLRVHEETLGPENSVVAVDLSNLAELCQDEGKYAEAEQLLQRALRIWEKAVGTEHHSFAASLNNLGLVYDKQGRLAEAESLYQRALRIDEAALGKQDPNVAIDLSNLATVYMEEGRYLEAEPLYQRSLTIDERTVGPDHPSMAIGLNNLAVLYVQEGKYPEAQSLYERALAIEERALEPKNPGLATSIENLAEVHYAQGQPQQAQPLYARELALLFDQFEYLFTCMSEKERLQFLATVSAHFPAYCSFVHQFHGQMPQLAGNMYDLLLWEKGFIAGSETALRRQIEASGDPGALKLLDQMAAKRAQVAALLNTQPQDRDAWRQQIEQLEAEANDLEKQLVARSAVFAQQKQLERVTWQQVRDALKPGEAAVEFARFPFFDGTKWTNTTYYVALVVTPATKDQPQYVVLGEGSQIEGKGLIEFQQRVEARGMESAEAVAVPGAQAYGLFWKPLEAALAGKRRVYLSPDGVLNQMPLGLIPAPDGKLLMEKYDLRLVSSTKDLVRPETKAGGSTAVLVGDPAFDLGEAAYRAALGKLASPQQEEPVVVATLAASDRSRDQGAGAGLPVLPGTGAEIEAVSSLLQQHQWQAASYSGGRALEEAVKQVRGPRVLHIATHGFFLPDQQVRAEGMGLGGNLPSGLEDPMLRSGLYFAGADRALAGQPISSDLDDGVLTAYEATGLNLQGTELVVLSACNTGQGDVKNGEGVFGLRRALQEAGAQAVMMSLWSVPDKETQELMTKFYSKWLTGMEKHEALRQAQLEERNEVQQRYGHDLPYYWGAFVLVGR